MSLLAFAFATLFPQDEPVHPLFGATPPDRMRAEYAAGREDAKRKVKPEDRAGAYVRDLGKVRSPRGWSFRASSASLMTEPFVWWLAGLQDGRTYRDSKGFDEIAKGAEARPEEWRRSVQSLVVSVALRAWPGVTHNGNDLTYSAKESDVKDVQFVMLVDGDPARALHPIAPPQMSGSGAYDGTIESRRLNSATVNTTANANASAYGSNGASAWVRASGSSTSTVTYATTSVEGYRAYSAEWQLAFPLYDEQGRPLVTASTKRLVLKVIRPNGELSTTFKLDDFKR